MMLERAIVLAQASVDVPAILERLDDPGRVAQALGDLGGGLEVGEGRPVLAPPAPLVPALLKQGPEVRRHRRGVGVEQCAPLLDGRRRDERGRQPLARCLLDRRHCRALRARGAGCERGPLRVCVRGGERTSAHTIRTCARCAIGWASAAIIGSR